MAFEDPERPTLDGLYARPPPSSPSASCSHGGHRLPLPFIALHARGDFSVNGEYPSLYVPLLHGIRYGSWSGSDLHVGTLQFAPFRAPAAITFAVSGYPSHPAESLVVRRIDTGESIAALPHATAATDPATAWQYHYVPIPPAWHGTTIVLVANDSGTGWGDWIGVSSLRAARIDERILRTTVTSAWSYTGLAYLALLVAGVASVCRRATRVWRDPCTLQLWRRSPSSRT